MSEIKSDSRRKFLKKSAYVVPVVMTMHAAPSLAGHGSKPKDHDYHDRKHKKGGKKKGGYKKSNNKRRH